MPSRGPWQWCGASVRGRAHVQQGLPNQDAWSVRATGFRAVAAVCDGLGSRVHSAMGARAGCRAVQSAASAWCARPGAPWELLVRLVHAQWAVLVQPHDGRTAATTCMLAVIRDDAPMLVAQLGDGVAVVARGDEGCDQLAVERDGFGNETTGLGIARSVDDWRVVELEPLRPGDSLLLATDGIGDDLRPETRADFARHMLRSCQPNGRADLNSRLLRKQIADWPVDRHTDDRTLVLCSNRGTDS